MATPETPGSKIAVLRKTMHQQQQTLLGLMMTDDGLEIRMTGDDTEAEKVYDAMTATIETLEALGERAYGSPDGSSWVEDNEARREAQRIAAGSK